jgi:hypothetical protein
VILDIVVGGLGALLLLLCAVGAGLALADCFDEWLSGRRD